MPSGYHPPRRLWASSPKRKLLWAALQVLARFDPVGIAKGELDVFAKAGPVAVHRMTVGRLREIWASVMTERIAKEFEAERDVLVPLIRGLDDPFDLVLDARITHFQRDWEQLYKQLYADVGESFAARVLRGLAPVLKARPRAVTISPGELAAREVARWIRRFGGERIAEITETTRKRVRRAIANGVEAGETIPQIASRVDGLFLEEIIPNRSEVIARTEVLQASALASHQAAASSGVPLRHVWLTAGDHRVRESHRRANGQRRPLGEPFMVGGEQMLYPGDPSFGASAEQTIMCRCSELVERIR
jgi:Phage Mu protein F like protein